MALIALTIIGFILVLVLAYKLGGVISSSVLGFFLHKENQQVTTNLSDDERYNIQQLFFRTVFSLLGYVAKSDGRVNEGEIKLTQVYMEKMALSDSDKQEAIRLFNAGAEVEFALKNIIDDFKKLAEKNPNMTEILLAYLINLARSDGLLVRSELKVLHEVAEGLGFTSIAFNHLLRMISSQNTFSHSRRRGNQNHNNSGSNADQNDYLVVAYDALGVSGHASNIEIKQAYRRLINQYHPDKLMGRGLPDFIVKGAVEQIARIQLAYDYIKQARGGF